MHGEDSKFEIACFLSLTINNFYVGQKYFNLT